MSIEAMMAIAPIAPIAPVGIENGVAAAAGPQAGFAAWFEQQLAQTNEKLAVADQGLQQLALGDTSNLHQVMMQFEDAKLSVQLVMQVRNRLLETYQDLMRMQM
ncbi:flagellar hook-basal body complex protein FliE [Andreprevotia lacus DSM 23236]|jgi:flagellar hook-basal body complex protein FliE|uniref:Flagellar hook-basal body complex protein FliE n=1 Tax=Andreprevotia lacus DSM 23236 TaxID=1121001 RepID=A0A1W1XUV9_9NEIS|nr:flagellar hook-basal body complex protein FliE [Andreprevotia lacus]SMC27686.1 flagellar hook-basal body complex protein FliE [Andreprevotia lacus DSM 23236]